MNLLVGGQKLVKISRLVQPLPEGDLARCYLRYMDAHDTCKTRGQDGIANSFPVGLSHPLQYAGLSRRSVYYRQPVIYSSITDG
jgi:hypothetical protein